MCVTGCLGVVKHCFLTCIIIYGFFHITLEMIQTIVPIGLLCVGFISIGVCVISVPQPDPEVVETVIGKKLTQEAEDPTGLYLKTLAHRGAALDAPENSLSAFDMCIRKGCKGIEFDVCLTADGVPVVFHDDSLERMTDSEQFISETRWEELSKIDISVKHPFKERFPNARIPTLHEAVELLLKHGEHMIIDIKSNNGKMINIILKLFEKYPELHSKAVVSSFFPNIVYYVRRSNPKIVASLAWRPHCFAYKSYSALSGLGERRTSNILKHWWHRICDELHMFFLPRLTYYLLGLSVILLHKDCVSPKVVADWKAKDVQVMAWTVNHPMEKQYCSKVLKIPYLTDTLVGETSIHNAAS